MKSGKYIVYTVESKCFPRTPIHDEWFEEKPAEGLFLDLYNKTRRELGMGGFVELTTARKFAKYMNLKTKTSRIVVTNIAVRVQMIEL